MSKWGINYDRVRKKKTLKKLNPFAHLMLYEYQVDVDMGHFKEIEIIFYCLLKRISKMWLEYRVYVYIFIRHIVSPLPFLYMKETYLFSHNPIFKKMLVSNIGLTSKLHRILA